MTPQAEPFSGALNTFHMLTSQKLTSERPGMKRDNLSWREQHDVSFSASVTTLMIRPPQDGRAGAAHSQITSTSLIISSFRSSSLDQ